MLVFRVVLVYGQFILVNLVIFLLKWSTFLVTTDLHFVLLLEYLTSTLLLTHERIQSLMVVLNFEALNSD